MPRVQTMSRYVILSARYDTMDPSHMEWMSKQFPHARYLYCANGSHSALYDDQKAYVAGCSPSFAMWTPETRCS